MAIRYIFTDASHFKSFSETKTRDYMLTICLQSATKWEQNEENRYMSPF